MPRKVARRHPWNLVDVHCVLISRLLNPCYTQGCNSIGSWVLGLSKPKRHKSPSPKLPKIAAQASAFGFKETPLHSTSRLELFQLEWRMDTTMCVLVYSPHYLRPPAAPDSEDKKQTGTRNQAVFISHNVM